MSSLLEPITADQWSRRNARHLLNRAGFGVPLVDAERLAGVTPSAAVDEMIEYQLVAESSREPDWLEAPMEGKSLQRQIRTLEKVNAREGKMTEDEMARLETEKMKLRNLLQAEEKQDIERLKHWWLRTMITTKRPLQEKMVLFWHGHFATSAEKVKSGFHNYQLNKLFREKATGNFKLLAYEVGCSPAMLRYLDNDQNNKNKPNENWARELMELFTLGIGNYTEEDVKNAARAFTGWSSDGEEFAYHAGAHDEGEKVFMGKRGNFNGNDIIDIIFEQKAAAEFITRKLWKFFVDDDPPAEAIEGLAATLRNNGYDMKPMLRQLFLARAFYAEKAVGTQIKSPAQLVVSMISQLNINTPPGGLTDSYLVLSMREMGQDLFYPPNVKGWDGGKAWINTNTLMARFNVANFLVQGVATDMGAAGSIQGMLKRIRQKVAERNNPGKPTKLEQAKSEMMKRLNADGAEGGADMQMMGSTMGDSMMGGQMMDGMDGAMSAGMGQELSKMDLKKVGVVGDRKGPKGLKLPYAPFDADAFFGRAQNMSIERVADFLGDYFYGRPMSERQRAQVLDALSAGASPQTPLDVNTWDLERLRGAVRLMLSTADFQVC